MPRTISSSEAQNNFAAIVQWAEDNQDNIVVERHGKPKAVIVSYDVYRELTASYERDRKQQALSELRALREEIGQYSELSNEDAYREAGFSERVAHETLRMDEKLVHQDESNSVG